MLMQASLGGELWTILRDRGTHAQLERLRVCMHCCWSLEYTCAVGELREHKRSWPGCEYECALCSWRYCKYACTVGQVVSTHAQLERLRVRMRSWRDCKYPCAVVEVWSTHAHLESCEYPSAVGQVASTNAHCAGDIASTHAQLVRLWEHMRSWRVCEYASAVCEVTSTHAQLERLHVCMRSWRSCEYACAVERVVSTHAQLKELRVHMRKRLRVRMRSWTGCEYACTVEGVASAQRSWIFIKSIRLYLDYYALQYMFVFYISNILSAFWKRQSFGLFFYEGPTANKYFILGTAEKKELFNILLLKSKKIPRTFFSFSSVQKISTVDNFTCFSGYFDDSTTRFYIACVVRSQGNSDEDIY